MIEKGSYFAITRGYKYSNNSSFVGNKAPEYSRDYEGLIFYALEVCGDCIAAKCIYSSSPYKENYVGKKIILNLAELEACPLTSEFVEAITGGASEKDK